jgi:hypothetical protein
MILWLFYDYFNRVIFEITKEIYSCCLIAYILYKNSIFELIEFNYNEIRSHDFFYLFNDL